MRVLIVGGGGMLGQKLATRIAQNGLGEAQPEVTLLDLAFPQKSAKAAHRETDNVAGPGSAERCIATRPDVIFYLAAIVSGEAERNFELGWRVNVGAFWSLLEAIRRASDASGGAYAPRLVFASSIAVFGGPYPDLIDDDFLTSPQSSYGAQKATAELMLADFSHKGFLDGIALRLPTVCVRPGKANLAASSFFSSIIREPLNGETAFLPVTPDLRHWHASPRSAVGFMAHAANLPKSALNGRYAINMPGVSCTVEGQIEALRQVAGSEAVARIKLSPDPDIARIVENWPRNFRPTRALDLGFSAESTFHEIIEAYIADDLQQSSRGTGN